MTATSGIDRDRAESEATTWLVRLSDAQGDAKLREAFEAWRTASLLNAESWERARHAYDLIGKRTPRHQDHWQPYADGRREARSLPPAQLLAPRSPDRARRTRWLGPRRVITGSAVAACIAVLSGVFLPGLLIRLQADVATSTAELRNLPLEDGSRVSLAPESAIEMTFVAGQRRVRLIKGNAFFDVSPDEAHPFRVEAGKALVTVLGTAFEVRRGEDGIFVAVQHGRVRVDDMRAEAKMTTTLHGGEWTRVPTAGPIVQGVLKQDEIAPWRLGRLVALNRPAGEVVDDLRPYYSGAILVQSRAFARRQVSGIYDLTDPRRTIRDLASAHGAQVHELSDWLMIITAGND
ncbi:MAG: FecR domain-containing protein [Proteobacteria bacterium]|nr:FecR domain-containing protein [Pseudomonadota bacterium]